MDMKLYTFALMLLGVSVSTIADILLKKSDGTNWWYIIVGVILYGLPAIPLAFVFNKLDFVVVFIIWQALSMILAVIFSIFMFHETMTLSRVLSVVFAVVAIYFSYK